MPEPKVWFACGGTMRSNPSGGIDVPTEMLVLEASSSEEALGKCVQYMILKYPTCEGWTKHTYSVDPRPFMPWRETP